MKTPAIFTPSETEIEQLIAAYPFALVVSPHNGAFHATPLPLLLQHTAEHGACLLGHFARGNPQVAALEEHPEALVVFQGPHGYMSPSWLRDRSQAPTWNFATVHYTVRLEFLHTPHANRDAVEQLTTVMEAGRTDAWCVQDMGARADRLLPAIIAFRAHIIARQAKFKLGQNEQLTVLRDMLQGLDRDGQTELAAMMRAANQQRI